MSENLAEEQSEDSAVITAKNDTVEVPLADTASKPAKKSRKKPLLVTALIAAVLLVAGAITVPLVQASIAHTAALGSYNTAVATLADAEKTVTAEQKALADAQAVALEQHPLTAGLVSAGKAAPHYYEPAIAVDDLDAALTNLTEAAGITADEAGVLTATEMVVKPASTDGAGLTNENTTDELIAGAETLTETTAVRIAQAKVLTAKANAIVVRTTAVDAASRALLEAANVSGLAWERPAKSSEESWAAFVAAVAAVQADTITDESDYTALAVVYVNSRTGVQASHDAVVAAEAAAAQAAAEQAARDAANRRNYNNKSNGSGGGGGSHNSGGGGGSSNGGGNSNPGARQPGGGRVGTDTPGTKRPQECKVWNGGGYTWIC